MYIGIDLGTSGIKIILMNEEQTILKTIHDNLSIYHPHPLWSEQDPNDWWDLVNRLMTELSLNTDLKAVRAVGITGQMHGAVLLGKNNNVLRPAILWNDGRCYKECQTLEENIHNIREITGNQIMPGFTAPKILWVKENEQQVFAQIDKVLLPKDFIRFKMTNEFATDMSDASGTMWLDVGKRAWNESILSTCGLSLENMPNLFEGNEITGLLNNKLAEKWKMQSVPIVAGGGDNAAGAIGMGIFKPKQAMLSLGTSGVYFSVTDKFVSKPSQAVHSFCHAIENTWHIMSVMLSATNSINWCREIFKKDNIEVFFNEIEKEKDKKESVYFLPYLSGERTPYNNPNAKGCFWGLTHQSDSISMAKSVLLGVSYALTNCVEVLHKTGNEPDKIILIGGGAQNQYWRQLISDMTGKLIEYQEGGEVGPALGAAKLAQIAINPQISTESILKEQKIIQTHEPNKEQFEYHSENRQTFNQLYELLLPLT